MTQREPWLPAELVAGTANPQQTPSASSFPRHRQVCAGGAELQMFPISNGPGVWGGYKCARRRAVCRVFGTSSAFTAVCSMGSFSRVGKLKVEKDEGRGSVWCSLGFDRFVSMCDE